MSIASTEKLQVATQRFVLHDVDWEGYQSLLKILGDRPVRVTYDRGDLELMSPHLKHERSRSRLGRMVEILTEELDIPMIAAGATTLKREDLDKGLEADESFYLASLSLISDVEQLDLDVDPPPDLAIEIEITRSALNRLGIYGALRVPEVWRFDGKSLRILLRQDDGTYRESQQSEALPCITIEELRHFVVGGPGSDTEWAKAFRRWVRETIVPRVKAADAGGRE